MNWNATGGISQGSGAIAVLLTLGYLSVRAGQNSHIQKTQAHADMTSNVKLKSWPHWRMRRPAQLCVKSSILENGVKMRNISSSSTL